MNDCKPCQARLSVTDRKNHVGWLTGILLVLLPKCPFCVLAYSGTLALCGNGGMAFSSRRFSSPETICLTSFLCITVLASILLNQRGRRTKYAFLCAAAGSLMTGLSVALGGGQVLYYLGVFVMFAGVWGNGSLLSVLAKFKRQAGRPGIPYSLPFHQAKKNSYDSSAI